LELGDQFKRLIKELGEAINESLSESDRIAEVMSRIRDAGYDLFLVLEVTIGVNKRGETSIVHREKFGERETAAAGQEDFQLTRQDAEFLRALKITIEDDRKD
jgi:hypothetical protein